MSIREKQTIFNQIETKNRISGKVRIVISTTKARNYPLKIIYWPKYYIINFYTELSDDPSYQKFTKIFFNKNK